MLGPLERRACRLRAQAPHRDCGNGQFVSGARGRREGRGVEPAEHAFGLRHAPDQQLAADLEIPCMSSVDEVAVPRERRARRCQALRGPVEFTRDERDLRLGDDAARARDAFLRTKGTPGTAQQQFGARQIAELRHGNAADRKRRRIIAQRDPLQRAQGIPDRERACGGVDQRVQPNPAKFVTPFIRTAAIRLLHHDASSNQGACR